jgi:type II secretory pathway component PulF
MIAVGEATGALDTMLAKCDFHDDEVDAAVEAMTALLSFKMVFLGRASGGMIIAMNLAHLKMASVFRG